MSGLQGKLHLSGLLRLPTRICNPPPSVGKVRSCGVTPVVKVRLDDVLNRIHLPPLGLKDFEEWLLYVEQYPSGLYFLLWLREYELRYNAWKSSLNRPFVMSPSGRATRQTPHQASTSLAMFFTRAKQTFLTPRATFELDVPTDLLAPFHSSSSSPHLHSNKVPYHPDPSVFADLQTAVRRDLEQSLSRFVNAQFSNAGGGRMICGLVAGLAFMLIGGLFPILYNMLLGRSRFLRLVGLPGFLLGLTVFIASVHGICVGIYIFGDFRQLHRFELARPKISPPLPLSPVPDSNRDAYPEPARLRYSIPCPPPPAATPQTETSLRDSRRPSLVSVRSDWSTDSFMPEGDDGGEVINGIYISRAYRDGQPVPASPGSPGTHVSAYPLPSSSLSVSHQPKPSKPLKESSTSPSTTFTPSAAFILPFQEDQVPQKREGEGKDPLLQGREWNETTWSYIADHPQELQPLSTFDFDGLPMPPKHGFANPHQHPTMAATSQTPLTPSHLSPGRSDDDDAIVAIIHPDENTHDTDFPSSLSSPKHEGQSTTSYSRNWSRFSFLSSPRLMVGKLQSKCTARSWSFVTSVHSGRNPAQNSLYEKEDQNQQQQPSESPPSSPTTLSSTASSIAIAKQLRSVRSVPPFSTPVVRVMSPVIVRAQFDIVARSLCIAAFLCCVIAASLLAIPEIHLL